MLFLEIHSVETCVPVFPDRFTSEFPQSSVDFGGSPVVADVELLK